MFLWLVAFMYMIKLKAPYLKHRESSKELEFLSTNEYVLPTISERILIL